MFKKISFIAIAILLLSTFAQATDVRLAWDANTEPDLAGYKIFWTTTQPDPAAPEFENQADVGNATTYTVAGLSDDTTYYFAATAYDTEGLESEYSDILAYTVHAGRVIIRVIDRPKNFRFEFGQ